MIAFRAFAAWAAALLIVSVLTCRGPAAAQGELVYTPPPAPPASVPNLACETPTEQAMFEQLKISWAAESGRIPAAEKAAEDAAKASEAARKAAAAARDAETAARGALNAAERRQASAAAITKAQTRYDEAQAAATKASEAASDAVKNSIAASNALMALVARINDLSEAWWKLVGDISKRKCAAPQPPAAPQPQPPPQPPTGNPPKGGGNQLQPTPKETPAPKAKCPSCQKVAKEIADLEAQIATQESKVAKLRQQAEVDVESVPSARAAEQKLSDLKAQKAALEQQLLKCEQSCAPKAATDGEVANTTGSVLQGGVLSGSVLSGVGATAAPVGQPNRSGEESGTGKPDQTGEHGSAGQPPGRSSAPNP